MGLKMEASKDYILKNARMGIKIFNEWINNKNEANELYYYECLATVNEFAPYDVQLQRHNRTDYGDYCISYHEIKLRDNNVDINDYSTSVIDANKIKTLQQIAYSTNNRCFVNVIYPKNRMIAVWEIEPDAQYQCTNKDVVWHSGSIKANQEVKLNKMLVELPISEAKKYHY